MTNALSLDANAIATLLQQEVKPVLFLGAGASVRSGIPLAGTLVDSIARFAYCRVHNRNPDDPTLMRSDWIRWLEQQQWYRTDVAPATLYPLAVEHLLQPKSTRKEFFQRVLKPDVPPSEGYQRLANLMARRSIRTILTTNFDGLIARTAGQIPAIRYVEEIFTESDHKLFRTNPPHPQVLYLHGSVNHYTDRNLIAETQELDRHLADLLSPLLRDHPLVVIGYRGIEPSIMKHLLIDRAEECRDFPEGIYWCHLAEANPVKESPLVAELSATIGSNLQFVEIDGFDELMTAADRLVHASQSDTWRQALAVEVPGSTQVNDLQPSTLDTSGLNEPLVRTKLVEYAAAMRLPAPTLNSAEQLWGAMFAQNLATQVGEEHRATKGGQLLFAKSAENQIDAARVTAEISGPSRWVEEILDISKGQGASDQLICESAELVGDLWSQLDQASNLLSRANRPFRMKGPVSQTAYPYPPLALKELLTNLLAHRDYRADKPAILAITREEIRFENPGGLVDSVRGQLEDESIQQVIGDGRRRLKGYRNPVVADFFFSAGAMDKEGSGLPDVLQEAANNLNDVKFGPTQDNAAFVAVIKCRPETLMVDEDTKTARPQQGELRYSPNLLRVIEWPDRIQKLGTVASYQDMVRAERAGCPPFGAHRNWIWTFANLASEHSRLLLELGLVEECHEAATLELLSDPDVGAIMPRLLNMALAAHLKRIGMLVRFEAGRLRAYYPASEGEPREISYRSSFRQSKRTVAKPIVSKTSGKIVYWEHKAVSLRFERFGASWALAMLPSYVFTVDGHSQSIASDRIGPLTTRRAARDYNPTVLHDLVFWARMLAAEKEPDFAIPLSRGDNQPVVRLASMIPTFVFQEAIESGIADASESLIAADSDLDTLQEEIEQVIADSTASAEEQNEVTDL